MISQAVVYPLDTLKFRMQCETVVGGERGNKLIWHTAQKMWARNGLASFYRGLPMGLMGMFPYAAIDLFMFETLKKSMIARNAKKKGVKFDEDALPGNFTLALMGGFSGAFGASIVYPLNLLRTRLQSQGTAGHPRTYTGIMDVTRQTLKHEGPRGLFKGLTPNLLKVVPAVSIVSVFPRIFNLVFGYDLLTLPPDIRCVREHKEGAASALVGHWWPWLSVGIYVLHREALGVSSIELRSIGCQMMDPRFCASIVFWDTGYHSSRTSLLYKASTQHPHLLESISAVEIYPVYADMQYFSLTYLTLPPLLISSHPWCCSPTDSCPGTQLRQC